ncbi:MAG: hypothetical protein V7752_17045 [Halopseudomonas sp.]
MLRLDAVDWSIRELIAECRDIVVSPYLIHHRKHSGRAKPGHKIRERTLTSRFKDAVDAVTELQSIDWGDNTPPSLHEIRSLSERLYEKQGINTQALLGHKHQKTTDTYHDARGFDWITVQL